MNGVVIVIQAVCIPHINIRLELPQLGKVVQGFTDKGYVLADSKLTCKDSIIDNVELILGSKSCYCLPQSEHLFGIESVSTKV